MRPASLFSAPDLARLPIVVNARAISLSEGIRAGLSVAVIIALNQYLAFAPLREAALAALLTCICDPGGPIRRRVPVLLSFALIGAAVTAGFGLLRDFGPAVALPLGVFGLFCSSFVRIYGQAPQQVGALLSTVQILSLDYPNPSLTEAGILAAAFVGGALWAILLTMVIWRIYPFLPARRAVAEAYRKLSELVRDLHTLLRTPAISDAAWEAHARIHRSAAREAIEAARTAVMDTLRSRGAASNRAAQAVIRLETADQIFGSLIALSDLLEHGSAAERKVADRVLRRMRPLLLILGRSMITDDPDAHHRIDRAIDGIVADLRALPADAPLRAVIDRIAERLRIAHTLAVPANLSPGVDARGEPIPFWPQVMRPAARQSELGLPCPAPRLAHGRHRGAAVGVHDGLVQPVRPLADDHRGGDDAAVLFPDLHAGDRTHRRHRRRRADRRGGRPCLHVPPGDRRGDVPARHAGLRGAGGQLRALHDGADAAGRAAGRIRHTGNR